MTVAELQTLMAGNETESVEFKPTLENRHEIARYAVGIGNAGGGHLVMGVTNRIPRRIQPVQRLSEDKIQQIRRSVYDSAQIHIQVENLATPDGNVVIASIPGRPRGQIYHTRRGDYLIRIGEDLRGLTLPEIDAIRAEAGVEFTAAEIDAPWERLIRPAGMEDLRALMREVNAPADLLRLSDPDILRSLGVLTENDRFLIAGLLLVGQTNEIRQRTPHVQWQFFRMLSDTDYDHAESGFDCLTVALRRLRELINANNPIVTIKGDLVHPEFPRYPVLAMRELLVNALAHRDFSASGSVVVKLYPDRIEITNPGGFPGDITPANILHHPSVPRNPVLFDSLARMRLANAANLGVPRVFRDLLQEGKEPPYYWTMGQTVSVAVKGQDVRKPFLDLMREYNDLGVDELLVIHYLTRHREITARQTADICQRPLEDARERLGILANRCGLLETAGGPGRGRYFRLSMRAYHILETDLAYHLDRRVENDAARARILAALGNGPLPNSQFREITGMNRAQVIRLLRKMGKEGLVKISGAKRGSKWEKVNLNR
jgi:ATP-dependent DNA helicase RecG